MIQGDIEKRIETLIDMIKKAPSLDEPDYSRPFSVMIVEDCRDEEELGPSGRLDGQYGVCLGMYDFPDTTKKLDPRDENGNPLIITEEGEYIFGIRCWFTPAEKSDNLSLEKLKEGLNAYKEVVGPEIFTEYLMATISDEESEVN
jgi:hypothetical protein